jgi:ABC-2 type transport system ATP-binding protein
MHSVTPATNGLGLTAAGVLAAAAGLGTAPHGLGTAPNGLGTAANGLGAPNGLGAAAAAAGATGATAAGTGNAARANGDAPGTKGGVPGTNGGVPGTNGHVAAGAEGQARPPGKQLLRVEGLAKQIGEADILEDINFSIYEGEILGLIGPNGAGKTTLMECLAGMRPRTGGVFYIGDDAPASWDPKELLFYLPNNVMPYGDLYTIEVLTFFGRLYEVDPVRWERIILHDLSLGPALAKRVSALSKGNMQRLLIALALLSPQPLLALDEPFDGLDLHQTSAMMGILRGLREQSRTLLLCIHQLNDAERICDRLLLLSGGHLVGMGTLAELRAQTGLAEGSLEAIFLALTGRPQGATAA